MFVEINNDNEGIKYYNIPMRVKTKINCQILDQKEKKTFNSVRCLFSLMLYAAFIYRDI